MPYLRKLALGLVFVTGLMAAPARAESPLSLANFQIAGIGAFSGTASSYFGQISWTPYFGVGPVGIRGEIGITGFDFGGGRTWVTNYEALLHLPLFPGLAVEGGGGLHFWHGSNPAALAITANVIAPGLLGFDRFFAGYTRYTGGLGANEIRVGFGFEL